MYDLDEIQFENFIIEMLKNDVISNVVGSYPQGKTTYPLMVTSMTTTPNQYDISKDIIRTRISLSIRFWHSTKTGLIDTKIKAEKSMLNFGFTRLNPTEIIIDNTNNKYYMEEQFVINYDNMNNRFERSI